MLAARSLGLRAKAAQLTAERLASTPLPAIAVDRDGGFFILAAIQPPASRVVPPDVVYESWFS